LICKFHEVKKAFLSAISIFLINTAYGILSAPTERHINNGNNNNSERKPENAGACKSQQISLQVVGNPITDIYCNIPGLWRLRFFRFSSRWQRNRPYKHILSTCRKTFYTNALVYQCIYLELAAVFTFRKMWGEQATVKTVASSRLADERHRGKVALRFELLRKAFDNRSRPSYYRRISDKPW